MTTNIYHITHVANLPNIIQAGCLWSDYERVRQRFANTGIGYSHIKQRRMARPVPVAAGGTLGQYVPFYFSPRSPMLYTIHMGNVQDYQGGQKPIVHLLSTAETAMGLGRPWAFTDLHAELGYASYYDDWSRKNEVDWDIIRSNNWGGGERRPKKMAEFLVHEHFPWTAIGSIGVFNEEIAGQVRSVLATTGHQPEVEVKSPWYY